MNILVTGGVGYIGSHTTVELLLKGYNVIIADNLSTSDKRVLNSIEKITGKKPVFFEGDLCNQSFVEQLFETNKIDSIIHFAAYKAVGESVANPLKYYKNNLESLTNLLFACNKYGVGNFVFSSSCTVYGQPDSLPVNESCMLKSAESPYGKTKQISEDILIDFAKVNNFNAILLRYFNPIGAHDSALIGEYPIGTPNNLVPFITQTAIGIRECLNIFGGDYSTSDGTCIRDYIHVVDLAKAHVIAIERLIDNKNQNAVEVFNLGTGTGYSVLETVKAFEKVSGVKLNYKIVERRKGDVEKIYSDNKLAKEVLGWSAERDLENMLKSAWNWEKQLNKQQLING